MNNFRCFFHSFSKIRSQWFFFGLVKQNVCGHAYCGKCGCYFNGFLLFLYKLISCVFWIPCFHLFLFSINCSTFNKSYVLTSETERRYFCFIVERSSPPGCCFCNGPFPFYSPEWCCNSGNHLTKQFLCEVMKKIIFEEKYFTYQQLPFHNLAVHLLHLFLDIQIILLSFSQLNE